MISLWEIEVTKGKLVAPALALGLSGDGEKFADATVIGLKRGPTDTKEVQGQNVWSPSLDIIKN